MPQAPAKTVSEPKFYFPDPEIVRVVPIRAEIPQEQFFRELVDLLQGHRIGEGQIVLVHYTVSGLAAGRFKLDVLDREEEWGDRVRTTLEVYRCSPVGILVRVEKQTRPVRWMSEIYTRCIGDEIKYLVRRYEVNHLREE